MSTPIQSDRSDGGSVSRRHPRLRVAFAEFWLDLRLELVRRRERRSLIRLGAAAAASGASEGGALGPSLAQVRAGKVQLDRLRACIAASLEADRFDFPSAAPWMRPVVVLRGLCARAVIRHQIAIARRNLMNPHEAIGSSVLQLSKTHGSLPPELLAAAAQSRTKLTTLQEERDRMLSAFGGSALPRWMPHLRNEGKALTRALWLQLRPAVLPRFSAMAGLAVGWWIAATYTDSHFRSVLSSLGLGGGGRRVVSGETYRAMTFWFPLLAAALGAYLADRIQFLIQRRYTDSTSTPGRSA